MEIKKSGFGKTASGIREMVMIGLFAAFAFVSAMVLHIPYGNGGVIQLGDSVIFIVAIMLGGRQAAISGAIGLAMFDVFSGYGQWAPFTLVIKAGMGLIIGLLAFSGTSAGNNWLKNIIGLLLSGAWMILGYYAAEALLTGNWMSPMFGVPGNVIQFFGSAVVAVIIIFMLKKTRVFNR